MNLKALLVSSLLTILIFGNASADSVSEQKEPVVCASPQETKMPIQTASQENLARTPHEILIGLLALVVL